MSEDDVGRFFDTLSAGYTEVIERCFPQYREMLWALLDYLPDDRKYDSILELGCGTGNLTVLLADRFPTATIHYVDLSGESLDVCAERLGTDARFVRVHSDVRELDYADASFDLVTSSIAIHHLESPAKRTLFAEVRRWLQPHGVFAFCDQFRGATDDLYERHVANWRERSLAAGATSDEFGMWMDHQREHDHHDTLGDQSAWLADAGFPVVDCVWRCLLWSVVQARP